MADRLDNLKHGECCDSVSNERAKYAPALQLLDHGQLHIGLHLQDGSYHTDRPMISGASRSPWLQKGATDGRSQAASWKIRLVRARRRMPRRPRRSTARCWGWKVQPFPMGDSTYEMIYAASGATRVIPPTRWRPAVAGAGMSCTPAIRRKRSRSTRRSSGSRTALWSGRTSRTTSSRRAASTAAE